MRLCAMSSPGAEHHDIKDAKAVMETEDTIDRQRERQRKRYSF
jgi:hypothetical protein